MKFFGMFKNSSYSKYQEFKKHRVYKYCTTVAIVILATVIQYYLWEYVKPAPFLLFYPAIILGSLYGDGMTAIVLSCLSWQYFFTEPYNTLKMNWPNDYVRMSMFLFSAFLVRMIVRRQTEQKLKAETVVELLNEEKEAREKFVSTLTHDLQTPITSAKLIIQIMQKKKTADDEDTLSLSKVEKSINRMEFMIRDLLDANQIRAGKSLPLNIQHCNLREVIERAVTGLNTIHGDRFIIRKAENLEGFWSCDALLRIIENLGTNAVKYGDPVAPIEICGEKSLDGVFLSVNNKGPIIPEEEQKILFNPYQRSKSAIKSSQKGWGLGLALVKGLAQSHGGLVKVVSKKEHGTTFYVYLPIDARKHQNEFLERD